MKSMTLFLMLGLSAVAQDKYFTASEIAYSDAMIVDHQDVVEDSAGNLTYSTADSKKVIRRITISDTKAPTATTSWIPLGEFSRGNVHTLRLSHGGGQHNNASGMITFSRGWNTVPQVFNSSIINSQASLDFYYYAVNAVTYGIVLKYHNPSAVSEHDLYITHESDLDRWTLPSASYETAFVNVEDKASLKLLEPNAGSATNSIILGGSNSSTGAGAAALGFGNTSSAASSVALGTHNSATATFAFASGAHNLAFGSASTSIGFSNESSAQGSMAIGWDNEAKGTGATALGHSNKATSSGGIAIGRENTASSFSATAIGGNNHSTAQGAVALGTDNESIFNNAIAIGYSNESSGIATTAIGWDNEASINYATAIGNGNFSSGNASVALGIGNKATAHHSVAIGGENEATASSALAMGWKNYAFSIHSSVFGTNNKSNGRGQFIIGEYNEVVGQGVADESIDADDYMFIIGNGSSDTERSNAFSVKRNGDVIITKPQGDLSMGEYGE